MGKFDRTIKHGIMNLYTHHPVPKTINPWPIPLHLHSHPLSTLYYFEENLRRRIISDITISVLYVLSILDVLFLNI